MDFRTEEPPTFFRPTKISGNPFDPGWQQSLPPHGTSMLCSANELGKWPLGEILKSILGSISTVRIFCNSDGCRLHTSPSFVCAITPCQLLGKTATTTV